MKMKCIIVLSVMVAMGSAAPQFLVDTPEVNAAKAQFFAAYNAAVAATAPVQVVAEVGGVDAVPYIHEEIPAEPYIHVEIPAEPYVHQEGPADDSAPVAVAEQHAGPVFNLDNNAYAGQAPFAGTCYNWKGEGVPCRTVF